MNSFRLMIMLPILVAISLVTGKQGAARAHGGGAGPTGPTDEQLKEIREKQCPKCHQGTGANDKLYCMTGNNKYSHWICKKCVDKAIDLYVESTNSKLLCPVCKKEKGLSYEDCKGGDYLSTALRYYMLPG